MDRGCETVVGIDFAGPASAGAQRRKILAVSASRLGRRRYAIPARGLNERLLRSPPGWTAGELAEALVAAPAPISVVAADFPFSLPAPLLGRASFARLAGCGRAFGSWSAFNAAVAAALPLACPVDYSRFAGWRAKAFWTRRASDVVSGAHPPLKDRFQVLFNMTLLGNAFLARLDASGRFDVVPFQSRGRAAVIEVYPGHLLRALGVRDYKRAPRDAIGAALRHLRSRGIALSVSPRVRAVCERWDTGGPASRDHDAADALVAACAAILHREGQLVEVVGAPPEARDVEGAIWSVAPARAGARRPAPRRALLDAAGPTRRGDRASRTLVQPYRRRSSSTRLRSCATTSSGASRVASPPYPRTTPSR